MIRMATVSAIALSLAVGAATAQNDTGKKASDGLGKALESMGQDLKKASGSTAKKDTKTSAKKKEPASTSNAKKK